MRSNSFEAESTKNYNRVYSSTLTKTSSSKHHANSNLNTHVSSTEDFICSEKTSKEKQQISDMNKIDSNTRRSRVHNQWNVHKEQVKRDLSMPPINSKEKQYVNDVLFSRYPFGQIKYSIDGNLDNSSTDNLERFEMGASSTPPPVQMVHEYVNRKAIIRPLAFRPVQTERSQNALECSPTKPPAITKTKGAQGSRISPPPVPPHSSRLVMKSNLGRVQSLKSGDSSGYYSCRTVSTANGNTSSADISPTFDNNGSVIDSLLGGEIYANTIDLINDYQPVKIADQDALTLKSSLESEITTERELNKTLESAIAKSNAKLLSAESHINELTMRLSQKSVEVTNALDSLGLYKRSLEHQSQKYHNLEKSMQSLQSMRNKDKIVKDKCTQTSAYTADPINSKLLEQFEEERRTWLDEKLKVLTYQKQIETNFQKLLVKCRFMEVQLLQARGMVKESRPHHPHPNNHGEDQDKSSVNSGDLSARNYLSNLSRIESTEHQASF